MAFDAGRLAADVAGLADAGTPAAWIPHFVPQHYDGDWSVLPLRAPPGDLHPILQIAPNPACRDWVDTPLLARCPYIAQVLASFACPLEAVRLMRLAPGSVIKEHRDDDLAAEDGMARLHIPVVTNPHVDFRLNGTRVVMDAGSVWYLRLADRHSVTNAGDTARIHLVVDAIVDPWLRDRLDAAVTLSNRDDRAVMV
ncbi:aspartyl beta-hydroxylase [Sphingomonas sp. Leaf33]|nr:aspartyl beta-hydroxylase [Sphingomonas sp. Leaf33]